MKAQSKTILVIELTCDLVYSVKFKICTPVFPSLPQCICLQNSLFNAESDQFLVLKNTYLKGILLNTSTIACDYERGLF